MNEKITIIQPNQLRRVDELVTEEEFQDLMDTSLTSLRSTPLIMPEANWEALRGTGITIEMLNLSTLTEREGKQMLREMATVYKSVFTGEPWNEVSICKKTGKFFAEQPGGLCSCCGTTTVEAYPIEETTQYIADELSRPNARCMIMKDEDDKIVGCAWGYSYKNPQEFATDKYPQDMQDELLVAFNTIDINGEFFYMSESFILPQQNDQGNSLYRGKGILNTFYQMFVSSARELGLPMIGRTTKDSPQVNNALSNFGFELFFGPKVISERRQVRVIENTYVNGIDKQNPNRVLYALGGANTL